MTLVEKFSDRKCWSFFFSPDFFQIFFGEILEIFENFRKISGKKSTFLIFWENRNFRFFLPKIFEKFPKNVRRNFENFENLAFRRQIFVFSRVFCMIKIRFRSFQLTWKNLHRTSCFGSNSARLVTFAPTGLLMCCVPFPCKELWTIHARKPAHGKQDQPDFWFFGLRHIVTNERGDSFREGVCFAQETK